MERKYYSVDQFVKFIGEGAVSKPNIYKLIQKGTIPAIYLGRKPLISAEWVKHFCKHGTEV